MKARYWVGGVVVVAATAIAIVAAANPVPRMHTFRFLSGHSPLSDEVSEFGWEMDGVVHCGHGGCADDGPALLGRDQEYVFDGSYDQTLRAARIEALEQGGVETPGLVFGKTWTFKDGGFVSVTDGHFDSAPQRNNKTGNYVRVNVGVSRQENFVGVGRRWIRSVFR